MSSLCDVVEEVADGAEQIYHRIRTLLVDDTATAAEVFVFTISMLISVTAAASDEVTENRTVLTAETAAATDVVTQTLKASQLVLEQGTADGFAVLVLTDTVDETADAAELVQSSIIHLVTDQASGSDAVFDLLRASTLVEELGDGSDSVFQPARNVVVELADASELVIAYVSARDLVLETASAADELDQVSGSAATINETASAADIITDRLHAVQLVEEEGIAEGTYIAEASYAAWACPVESFGMSRYEGVSGNSIAEVGGRIIIAGDDGLYTLDGADPVDALVDSGELDTGIYHHAAYAYFGYRSDGTLSISVTVTQTGEEETYDYDLEPRTANAKVPGRVRLGRGLMSRYWRFVLRNKDGADFLINDAVVVTDPTTRRV